ncbi:NADH dehydrogenase [ubiquinone] iron-sulfur protein 5-like [Ostrinia nubilalis]|uniref:NADH dehydrogenase [ubiquinone] iron-sulfur protein 5-like n=1 Tax=Ostrinia furnacalis TaxID=93504 RepID=UPI00103E61C5|nr:NADH dehydrogenase [ubiquinone] iron-sulfur protein 5-like [Ostrinia furnacalis]
MYKINSISPFLRSPMTDITGGVTSHQLLGRCAKQEMEMMDCLEAYGMDRGVKKCSELIDDFSECHNLNKQFKRFVAIRSERNRQIAAGKLTGDNKYVTPKIDSF